MLMNKTLLVFSYTFLASSMPIFLFFKNQVGYTFAKALVWLDESRVFICPTLKPQLFHLTLRHSGCFWKTS